MFEPYANGVDQKVAVDQDQTILVIGHESFAQSVRQILDESGIARGLQVVPDCLMALGQLAVGSPTVLICHIDQLDDPLKTTVAALRQLAGKARFLLVAPALRRVDAECAVAAGFDQYLLEPLASETLIAAVLGHRSNTSRRLASNHGEVRLPVNSYSSSVPRKSNGFRASGTDPLNELKRKLDLGRVGHDKRQSCSDQVDRLQAAETTMIKQMLQDQAGSISQMAINSAITAIGISGVNWCDQSNQVPQGHTSVAVEFDQENLGLLHAPESSVVAEQLRAWTTWLGRWLALGRHVDELWELAMRDEMTGLWNRRYFNRFLNTVLDQAANERFYVSLLVFDIDDFKTYNDRYGHIAGDDILQETARLMQTLIRDHDVVARIGGDEFAVIFWDPAGPRRANSAHPHDAIAVAQRFQSAICSARFPKLGHEAPGTLTISGGLAGFPWDGRSPEQLLDRADKMALRSKQQGKNAITFGPGAQRLSSESSA